MTYERLYYPQDAGIHLCFQKGLLHKSLTEAVRAIDSRHQAEDNARPSTGNPPRAFEYARGHDESAGRRQA